MTRAIRDRILKDANGDISDHLRNHVHLTNCIHLKNHMHKHSPIMADRSIMRDLMVLQRSRSLRDPSASPPSWHSPSVVDLLPRKGNNDVMIREGRTSVGTEYRRDSSRLSGSSPQIPNFVTSKAAPGEAVGLNDAVAAAISEWSSKSGNRDRYGKKVRREESSQKSRTDPFGGDRGEGPEDQDVVSGNSKFEDRRSRQKGKQTQDIRVKPLSKQLNDIPMESDDLISTNFQFRGGPSQLEKTGEEPGGSIRVYSNELNRVKRRKFRGARRPWVSSALRYVEGQSKMSVASNSLAQGSARPKYHMEEEEEEYREHNVTGAPRTGCGIPWNWSRIHHRGKTFLDRAGRSLTSCGLPDSRIRNGRDVPDMPVASDRSSSSPNSDGEALPLLLEASGSQSTEHAGWVHDYSGDVDSDLASEGRSGDQHKMEANCNGRHQSLTQKYMPRTFRDLVGQNLVVQALFNAVMRRKVGLLYVFYGPHGTGKTSCARIFARSLNCQSLEQPKPCGFCSSCISHDMGKSGNIKEVGPVSKFDFESILDLLDNMVTSHLPSQYRILVLNDCDTLSPDCWSAISKVIDRAPRCVVFLLICSSLDALPHIIISRCQKFFFPKLKDADIICTLQWIASKEDIEIDRDAVKLIASRSDGSLRDAEMTLEQLSLLGQRISVPLVQELVGLISDEKLVDLLDLALSADTVNTVKNLRVIMETGVEPLDLMSQLATVITDILAGSYDFTQARHRRKFFRRQPLSKEEMEKLRQALKTLSNAEKQLRISNDKLTWLTAALLQLAPDQQYVLPSSSAEASFSRSSLAVENAGGRAMNRKGGERSEISNKETGMPMNVRLENFHPEPSGDLIDRSMMKGINLDRERHAGSGMAPQQKSPFSTNTIRASGRQISGKSRNRIEEIWFGVLNKIQNNGMKEFLYREGKLMSVSFGAAPTVQLTFSSHLTKSKAEKFKDEILKAFESVLGSPLTIEIRCESKTDTQAGFHPPPMLPASKDGLSQMVIDSGSNIGIRGPWAGPIESCKRVPRDRGINGASNQDRHLHTESLEMGRSEIVEVPASSREIKDNADDRAEYSERASFSERKKLGEQSQCQSIVRNKVSLAHVIQQTEGCTQRNGWSKRKAVSIAERLEQENLRLEPRSRSFPCWKASKVTRRKLCRLKIRTRKPRSLLKLISCGKCLSSKSPR